MVERWLVCLYIIKFSGDFIIVAVDLHTHSTFSDGTLSPTQLVKLARKTGLTALALTDHDTVEGLAEALKHGKQCGVDVIPGLEIGCLHERRSYHILGYWIDRNHSGLLKWLKKLQQGRSERNRQIIAKLGQLGIDIDEEELARISKCGQAGRPHIARLLIDKKIVPDLDQAFQRFLRLGAPAYVSRFVYSAAESIAMIREAGGVSVLAHPVQVGMSHAKFSGILQQLVEYGLDGIEVYYPSHTRKMRRRLRQLASRFDLAMTGGSDFHGDNRPAIGLSGDNSGYPVPDELVPLLYKQLHKTTLKN